MEHLSSVIEKKHEHPVYFRQEIEVIFVSHIFDKWQRNVSCAYSSMKYFSYDNKVTKIQTEAKRWRYVDQCIKVGYNMLFLAALRNLTLQP